VSGDHAGALAAFRRIVPAVDALNGAGMQAPTAKAALELLGLLPSRATRLPIVPLSDAELGELRTDLVRAGLLDLVAG
jgi:4-hydroxy-tetrahydrodipicolinate synthase